MSKHKLPIGIQDFEKIITNGFTYIDKTKLIYQLIVQGNSYFLSRPRRFGKSLLISTLYAIFAGKRDLFKNLWIHTSDWEWISYPIIYLDMSTINSRSSEMLEQDLIRVLNEIASQYKCILTGTTAANYLENLIHQLADDKKVVILIDEYDRPLIDNIDDLEIAKSNLRILREFYTILKAQDHNIKFAILTGVTKFAKVSVFSGLNNLNDLTMSNEYSALLGYTRSELEHYFKKEVESVASVNELAIEECYEKIKEWYNGYKFSKSGELVYNPFSTLKLLDSKDFAAYWFETGTPSFLIDLISKREFNLSNLEQINVSAQSFSSFDIEDLPTLPLLYQTGYLTIKSYVPHISAYCLGFPNREVSQSFSESLLTSFARSQSECNKLLFEISANLYTQPWEYSQFFDLMAHLLALIPYDLYVKHERYFHSLFYLTIKLAGFQIGAEIHTQQGRTDAVLEAKDKVIIFEFKLNESPQAAIDQIMQKKYYELYQKSNRPIYLAGINFNGEERSIDGWEVKQL
ncbi:MAG: AAA family ATPase [Verrucomicrobia bacterium]|nr:AAA family ATPase [Verrucomicrobiota bacterium]